MNDKHLKLAIVTAAHGNPDPPGEKTLENLDRLIVHNFPHHDVRWGIQAQHAIETYQEMGKTTMFARRVPIMTAEEVLAQLASEGTKKVVMLIALLGESHLSRGIMDMDTHGMMVKYVAPFFTVAENIAALPGALEPDFADGTDAATILAAAGARDVTELLPCFKEIDNQVRENYQNVFFGTLRPPGMDQVIEDVKKSGCRKVRIISLLLTAHAHYDDIMGDGPDSVKTKLGLPVEYVDKFATYPIVTNYFVNSIKSLLSQLMN